MMGILILTPDAPRWRLKLRFRTLGSCRFAEAAVRTVRQGKRAARLLRAQHVRTVLLPEDTSFSEEQLEQWGLRRMDTGPFCRFHSHLIALAALKCLGIDREEGRIVLRGNEPDADLRRAAEMLCRSVKGISFSVKTGERKIAEDLYYSCGVGMGKESAGRSAHVALNFAPPKQRGAAVEIDLWGRRPQLDHIRFSVRNFALWERLTPVEQLSALWESGALPQKSLDVEWT